jgi:hypothetical protein
MINLVIGTQDRQPALKIDPMYQTQIIVNPYGFYSCSWEVFFLLLTVFLEM